MRRQTSQRAQQHGHAQQRLQRRQAQVAQPIDVAFFQSLFVLAQFALLAPFMAVVPGPEHLGAIVGSAVTSLLALGLLSAFAAGQVMPLLLAGVAAASLPRLLALRALGQWVPPIPQGHFGALAAEQIVLMSPSSFGKKVPL